MNLLVEAAYIKTADMLCYVEVIKFGLAMIICPFVCLFCFRRPGRLPGYPEIVEALFIAV